MFIARKQLIGIVVALSAGAVVGGLSIANAGGFTDEPSDGAPPYTEDPTSCRLP